MKSLYADCAIEIEQLKEEIKQLKARLKSVENMDEDEIDYIDDMIEIKETRIGDLEGQQAEIRYIDNGNAANYEGYEW